METNLLKYRAFTEIGEGKSFTEASEILGVSQSGISRMISDLEADWGFRLFERDRNGVQLTREGASLLPYAKALCSDFKSLESAVTGLKDPSRGHLYIGVFSSVATYWVPEIISRFKEDYPDVTYDLMLGDYAELEEWVAEGTADFAFSHRPSSSELEWELLDMDEYLAVMRDDDPMAFEDYCPAHCLEGRPFMLLERGGRSEVGNYLDENRVQPDIRFRTWDDYSVMSMVSAGLGMGVLPSLILKNLPERVVTRPLKPPLFREIGVIRRKGRPLTPVADRFMDYLKYR
ncbi:MAG: LysR family transcriptional regulator [Candidatus Methanomethylophilus sp.]|nr:LysR family transcriptional regulator [Methanomethylophilus sp.]